jgi:DNA replication protein DnaC
MARMLEPKELEALDHPRRHQLPNEPGGFGLLGSPGLGKTWALVQHVADMVDRTVRRQPNPDRATLLWIDGEVARDERIAWVYWPRLARELQDRPLDNRWHVDVAESLEDARFLVLDDIGREFRKAKEDPAREVFARVIERRERRRLPLLWTSNLERNEFTDFYGGPMASRILGAWPDYQVEGQDMRLFPVDEFKRAAGGDR